MPSRVVLTVSLRGTSVIHMSLFQFGFERRNVPVHQQRLHGVRRERPVKEEKEEVEEKGSKEDREKASAAKRREVPNSEYNVLHLHEDNLRLT